MDAARDRQQPQAEQQSSLAGLLLENIEKINLQPVLHIDQAFMGFVGTLREIGEKIDSNVSTERIDHTFFQVDVKVSDLFAKAIGCRSCCPFCGRKCQETQHQAVVLKHNCDKVGHQLRIYRGGTYSNQEGDLYPSLSACDMLRQDKPLNLQGVRMLWQDILSSQLQPVNWQITYQGANEALAAMKKEQENTWAEIGEEFLKQPNAPADVIFYAGNVEEEQAKNDQKILIVVVLDESTSMKGEKWEIATSGVKGLIKEIQTMHKNPENVHLELIFFATEPRKVWHGNVTQTIPGAKWDMEGGFTYYGKALKKAFDVINEKISAHDSALLYFFTDGHAGPDVEAMI